MKVEELHTFLEVIETGNLVTAARRLKVTPSTVTTRINALEEELGQKLLNRMRSGTQLTPSGVRFRRYAEDIIMLWRQARTEVALPQALKGVCNVGVDIGLAPGLVRSFLDNMRNSAPAIALALWPGLQLLIHKWLDVGLIDIAFCYTPPAGNKYTSRLLYEDELIRVSSERDAPVKLGPDYVFVDHGDEFRRQHALAYPGSTLAALIIASSDWALDHLLRKGGTAYLSRRNASDALKNGKLFEVDGAPAFRRGVYAVENTESVRHLEWYPAARAAAASL